MSFQLISFQEGYTLLDEAVSVYLNNTFSTNGFCFDMQFCNEENIRSSMMSIHEFYQAWSVIKKILVQKIYHQQTDCTEINQYIAKNHPITNAECDKISKIEILQHDIVYISLCFFNDDQCSIWIHPNLKYNMDLMHTIKPKENSADEQRRPRLGERLNMHSQVIQPPRLNFIERKETPVPSIIFDTI